MLWKKNPGNNFGNTPLHLATTHGHLEVCRLILKNTSDCSPENNFGKTPLEFAHKNGHTEVCKFLEDISHSLNIFIQSPSQSAPAILKNRAPCFLKIGHPAFCKKQAEKNRVILYSKKEETRLLLLFLNNTNPGFLHPTQS